MSIPTTPIELDNLGIVPPGTATGQVPIWDNALGQWVPGLIADANVSQTANIGRAKLAAPAISYNKLAADTALVAATWTDLVSGTLTTTATSTYVRIFGKIIFDNTAAATGFIWVALYEGATINTANVLRGAGTSSYRLAAAAGTSDRAQIVVVFEGNVTAATHTYKLAAIATNAGTARATVAQGGVTLDATSITIIGEK